MANLNPSRRRFLKTTVIAGITAYIAPFGSAAYAALFDEKILTPIDWDPVAGRARFRVDGMAKVTGAKVFARDIRARDLPHWPAQQSHALVLRATRADAVYRGFDLARLGGDLKPDRIVTAADLQRDGVAFTDFYGEDMLLPEGKTPAYLGQAVAILIYHDFAHFRLAKNTLQFQADVIRYGASTGPLVRDPWGTFRFVRVGGKTPYDDDVFSSLKDAPVFPSQMRKQLPVWPDGKDHGNVGEEGMFHAASIRRELDDPPKDWLVVERRYQTQSVDTAALEPDNANCWYDAQAQALHMVVPTQSPSEVVETAGEMLAKAKFPVKSVFLHPCYTVGYGSKDHCNMPFYGLVCALYSDGHPVRLANDRYEQFQTALKRHAFDISYRLAVDRKTGLFQSFTADMTANGGGRCNFSPSVAMVGATAAQSIYYLPKTDLTARADASRAVDAGSARGYGTLQSMVATELMVDDVAQQLGLDPIELRLKNVLKTGMKNTQGAIPAGAVRADEILRKAQKHPLWINRASRKKEYEASHPGRAYGIGFACVQKDFGTGAESSFAKIEVSPEGRIMLRHTGTEIGTGMSTSQAIACVRWLGSPATDLGFAITDWPDLPMKTSGDPYLMSQSDQDGAQADPQWTPALASPASASNSAFYYTHTTREACRVIFQYGLWPAALALWGSGTGGGQAAPYVVRQEDARWEQGLLTANGMQGLSLAQLAAKAHEMGGVVGVVVHGFNRWQWAEAEFQIGKAAARLAVDGLALYFGAGAGTAGPASAAAKPYRAIKRTSVYYPPVQRNNAGVTYYSAMGSLAEIDINLANGEVELLNHHSIIECGNVLSEELVSGQIQGGIAMGIGHALYEYLPLYEDGPGNGTWNFNRYHLPRAKEVALWSQSYEVLPPLSETDPPKGMAEVVMIPIVGAIVNGVAHATGHRFNTLPLTPEKIQEALA
ncbi:molybdopterin-dependent oxidoreductase [Paralcaligenes sp. KSB-10]|jgi:CO/xanthine dehydrogenase Mo-binding subunit|uniref:xanthine dehydrogenase family protein molybdopterin-binding subunit n=1 Tax=Paralcaligenes sp. KSB-10 TaxID=2901142 RepID=UPI001E5DB521|nr:molybdopterin cofactor-binding domain-containing protein [Paralcaligenes sp. KSB-10]UHL65357.1 molybdopterin-dependent oxidoreductase [Paralcaligenes sp. KSB-10]